MTEFPENNSQLGDLPTQSEEMLAELRRQRGFGPLPLAAGLFCTIFIHAVVVYAAYYATTHQDDVTYTAPPLIDARLVKFGKSLDPSMLPKKLRAPPPPRKKTTGITTDPSKIKSSDRVDAPDPLDEDHTSKEDTLLDSLDEFDEKSKPGEEVFAEGHETGVKEGTLIDPRMARAGDRFYTELVRLFRKNWSVPAGMTDATLKKLKTRIHIDFSRAGKVTDVEVIAGSGNALYDSAVKAAVMSVTEIPDPPEEWEFIYIEGLTFEYKGADM